MVAYYRYGKLDREAGPAWARYWPNGGVKDATYCSKGRLHRVDGPASISRREDGTLIGESYYLRGKRVVSPGRTGLSTRTLAL